MSTTPYDDVTEVSRRCAALREALSRADDDVITTPNKKYLYLCKVSGERPNATFQAFTEDMTKVSLDLHKSYLSQRALLPVLLTLPLCTWLERINLREERLTTTLIHLLCEALCRLPRIKVIDVSGNPFGSFGVDALLKLVKCNQRIVDCRMDGVQCVGSLRRRLADACERNAKVAHTFVDREEMPSECCTTSLDTTAAESDEVK
ncbi:uncharacterized protein TEOVI_000471000 [Trypanosoma equiperdum]|uniref:Leucine-rich repeat protein (LRRP) n=2 Tax=Trypanozoon TaxID=39700 RepID=Q581V2_TRYB2|nr:hypothetical protein, conserved [Trypanosoma brucei brucei TREU927]AAX79868.1 hypothetical protein, conserved [Trypanosoma brucei]AAZ10720.1 hypothetical protein, conserved [Trypanosoma brucei brucei TREU927]SCU66792.1 hypothetical protein, conserved [Trypanosoma equiperdum]